MSLHIHHHWFKGVLKRKIKVYLPEQQNHHTLNRGRVVYRYTGNTHEEEGGGIAVTLEEKGKDFIVIPPDSVKWTEEQPSSTKHR
jgi:hypothetical protein